MSVVQFRSLVLVELYNTDINQKAMEVDVGWPKSRGPTRATLRAERWAFVVIRHAASNAFTSSPSLSARHDLHHEARQPP